MQPVIISGKDFIIWLFQNCNEKTLETIACVKLFGFENIFPQTIGPTKVELLLLNLFSYRYRSIHLIANYIVNFLCALNITCLDSSCLSTSSNFYFAFSSVFVAVIPHIRHPG